MQQALNLLLQVFFPIAIIGVFWFATFLVVSTWFGKHFNVYISGGVAWFSLFSIINTFVLLFSVKIALAPWFFVLIAIVALLYSGYFLVRTPFEFFHIRRVGLSALGLFLLLSVLFIVNNWGHKFAGSSFASLGTLHTGKYAYISEYMVNCRKLPPINNNLGQSIVTAFFSASTRGSSSFILLVILAFSFLSLALIGFGAFIQFFPESTKRDRIFALLIFLMGNYAFSLALPTVNDSGNPLILVGYSDTLMSVLFFLILIEIIRMRFELSFAKKTFLLAPGIVTLWVSSPQTLLLIPIAIIFLLAKKSLKEAFFIFALFLMSIVAWRNQSGMLSRLSESVSIPGIDSELMKISKPGSLIDLISPGFPYVVNSLNLQNSPLEIAPKGIDLFKSLVSEGRFTHGFPVIDPERFFWYMEQIFLTTLRPIFWPLIAIITSCLLVSQKRTTLFASRFSQIRLPNSPIYIFGALNLLVTFPITFLLQMDGRKWELTRFSFLNWAVGMYLLAFLYLVLRREGRTWIPRIILLMTVLPTVVHLALKISTNLTDLTFQLGTPLGVIGMVTERITSNCLS